MPKIIRFHETGGADVLKVEDLPLIEPGKGEVRLVDLERTKLRHNMMDDNYPCMGSHRFDLE